RIMVDILAKSPHIRHHIVDLVIGQKIPECRHDLREPTRRPAMDDGRLPVTIRLRRRAGAIGEVRKRIRPQKYCARHRSTLPVAPMTRKAASVVDLPPVPHIRALRVMERLRRQKKCAHTDKCKYAQDDASTRHYQA